MADSIWIKFSLSDQPRLIKKYANRRLYDTAESRYIVLSDILALIRRGESFQVLDAQTDEDITRSVLVQIIIEQESGERPLFTTDMLSDFIRHYDEGTRLVFSEFLERNFKLFTEQQNLFQNQMDKLVGKQAINTLTDIAQGNLDFWQKMQENFFKSVGAHSDKSTESDKKTKK
ncbi:MAG: polyhydroxyalkanoate synthesis repressor PhaR [Alphaproteobacteria bacterium]|nr:polyhydroxyalkanoate synthesis repressor PhaR [Alphaproteobacteria bacterium]NCQ88792.1 polyhydroxyalkanoate synthesis repressor PhaR [Alphaproteobacteria bacterium]NCT07285.1 polyhydroxyalkanoate synthesis repressor PhaR [Alphaproteobacteria bacterium]